MPDYDINTFAELCQRIIDSDGKGVENLVAVTSPGAFACTIKIEGDGYCGEIPGFLLQSLSEFQTQAFRAYAMAVYGKDDLRGLDKSKLWCSVQSRQGSLDLVFCLAVLGVGIGTAMIKDMSATQKTILGLGVFAVFAGYIGADIYKTYSAESIEVEKQETERQKIEADTANRLAEQDTIRTAMILLSKQASEKDLDTLVAAGAHGRVGVDALIRDARGAVRVTYGKTVVEQDEIKRIQSPESVPVKRYPREGIFKIVQVNTENPELWKVLLKDTVSSEKILSSVTPSTLFLSAERAKELLDYQRDETPLKVTMSCAEKGDSKTYTIDQMELYVE